MHGLRWCPLVGLLVALMSAPASFGQAMESAEPFKVGTFDIDGVPRVGLVLRDSLVIDIAEANRGLESDPAYPKMPMPEDMLELIGRYEYGLKYRLYEIVNHLVRNELLGSEAPGYVHSVGELRIRPPIMYPGKILNAAVNFYSHVNESGTEEERVEARRQRRENRGVPYLFIKPSRGAVVGSG